MFPRPTLLPPPFIATTSIRRGTVLTFDAATWTAEILLDGSDAQARVKVGEWIPAAMMDVSDEVAVLMFSDTNTDDGVVLGPYGGVSTYNYPELAGLAVGSVLRATAAGAAAFGAVDLADADAITGVLPIANGGGGTAGLTGTWTPIFLGTTIAGAFTYSVQQGLYIKAAGVVFVWARCTITAIPTPPTGNMRIGGLPITSAATYSSPVVFGRIGQFNNTAAAIQLTGIVLAGGTVIQLEESFDNGATVAVPAANFTNVACDLIFSAVYPAA